MVLHERRTCGFFKMIPWIIIGIFGAAALALLFGLIVMVLWNWIMPEIFSLPEITYWQAWGIVLLAHILFKGPLGHHDNHHNSHHHEQNWNRDDWHRKFHERFNRPGNHGGSDQRDVYGDEDGPLS